MVGSRLAAFSCCSLVAIFSPWASARAGSQNERSCGAEGCGGMAPDELALLQAHLAVSKRAAGAMHTERLTCEECEEGCIVAGACYHSGPNGEVATPGLCSAYSGVWCGSQSHGTSPAPTEDESLVGTTPGVPACDACEEGCIVAGACYHSGPNGEVATPGLCSAYSGVWCGSQFHKTSPAPTEPACDACEGGCIVAGACYHSGPNGEVATPGLCSAYSGVWCGLHFHKTSPAPTEDERLVGTTPGVPACDACEEGCIVAGACYHSGPNGEVATPDLCSAYSGVWCGLHFHKTSPAPTEDERLVGTTPGVPADERRTLPAPVGNKSSM